MTYAGLIKRLQSPLDWTAPKVLTFHDIRAEAITRGHLTDDVRGINAGIELVRRTRGEKRPNEPVTEDLLDLDVEVSWRVTPETPPATTPRSTRTLRHWPLTEFP